MVQVLSLWRWLSLRFGEEHFPGAAQAEELAQQMVGLMDLGLQALSKRQVRPPSSLNLLPTAPHAAPCPL